MTFEETSGSAAGAVEAAARHLSAGGLLVHPTTGVYGIGGGPGPELDREIARLKGRPAGPGIVRLVSDPETARRAFPAAAWPPLAERLAQELWPGPLTLVLEDGSPHGVAVRVEPHAVTRYVLLSFGGPLGSSSLNRSGEPAAADPQAVRAILASLPAPRTPVLFVEAGRLPGPPPSTLVAVPGRGGAPYEVIREGAVGVERIARIAEGGGS